MSPYQLRWPRLASFVSVLSVMFSPAFAQAATPLTHGNVQNFRNRVEVLQQGGLVRPLRNQDRLGSGDSIRTHLASQADLQLNDGSFVRLGELTTFWMVTNTRTLWLAQGTGLMALAADRGNTQIETPNAVAQVQGATVVVRHVQPTDDTAQAAMGPGSEENLQGNTGRTAIMVLSDPEQQGVRVSLRDGGQVDLAVGQMAIIDGDTLYLFEFNRDLFYQTSYLAQGLPEPRDDSTEPTTEAEPADSISNEEQTAEFAGDYWLDPRFLSPNGAIAAESGWLFPANTSGLTTTETESPGTPSDSGPLDSTDSPPEPEITTPNPTRRPAHNELDIETELSPPPTVPPSPDETLPAPGDSNTQNLNIPAGVITPPSETLPLEPLSEPDTPLPNPEPDPTGSEP